MTLFQGILVARAAGEMELKSWTFDRITILAIVIQPAFLLFLTYSMLDADEPSLVTVAVIGSGLTTLWGAVLLHAFRTISFERSQGTLELLELTPANIFLTIAGKLGAALLLSFVVTACTYLLFLLTGEPMLIAHPVRFLFSLPLFLMVLWFIGIALASFGLLGPEIHRWLPILGYPIPILSGFLFPPDALPDWLWPVQALLPTYWCARATFGAAIPNLAGDDGALPWIIVSVELVLLSVLAPMIAKQISKKMTSGSGQLAAF